MENDNNDKKWEKPEMTILFSGNVSENVMSESGGDDGGGIDPRSL